MPSPIAHATLGFVIYRLFRHAPQQPALERAPCFRPLPPFLLATVGLSLLPDLDAVVGAAVGDIGRFHNNVAHSALFGLLVAFAVGSCVWRLRKSGFLRWVLITLLCYELHVAMDYLTTGRGIMVLWPFSEARYSSPVHLFYGLHWSDGWLSQRHLWTLLNELSWVALVGSLIYVLAWRRRRAAARAQRR
jgi:inner membrane protein